MIWAWINRVHPKYWAAAYFAAIPLFAVIYSNLPGNSFYEPYIHYDPSITAEAQAITDQLRDLFSAQLATIPQDPKGWVVTSLNPFILQPDSNGTLYLTAQVRFDSKNEQIPQLALVAIRLIPNVVGTTRGETLTMHWQIYFEDATSMPVNLNNLFSCTRVLAVKAYDFPCLGLTKQQSDRLNDLVITEHGWPANGPGQFWRLFYLSAITITTVGYGDIVPMTWSARFFTAAEAICGIVLIGLFLNSVVRSPGSAGRTS